MWRSSPWASVRRSCIDRLGGWFCRWLPIVFGCHCRPDRSFFYKGRQFPLCARCTGELIGILAGVLLFPFWAPPVWAAFLALLPLVVDGFTQRLTRYESTNPRRLVTGLAFGWGLYCLFAHSTLAAFFFGFHLLR